MSKDSNNDADELKETLDKAKKDITKGLLSGFAKLKDNVVAGIQESKIQEHIQTGDVEQLATSGKVLGDAVVKGVVTGLSELADVVSVTGGEVINAVNKVKKSKEANENTDNDFDDFDDYEIIDEE